MHIREFEIKQADGIALLNDIRLNDKVLAKGHILNKEDILLLKVIGIKKISGIEVKPTDITADIAIGLIASKICGDNIVYTSTQGNDCKIVANKDGIFICSDDRIAKFNRISSEVVLNISTPYKTVKKGDVVAVLEIFSPILEQDTIDDMIFRLSGNESLLSVETERAEKAAIIYTRIYNDDDENKHFTSVLKKLVKSFAGMNIEFANEYSANHNPSDIADAVQNALERHNLVFVIPGAETSNRLDAIPSALNSFVDDTVCKYIPQKNAHDLIIATKKQNKVIVVPYNYDIVDSYLIDKFIRMSITKDKISQADFSHPENLIIKDVKLNQDEINTLILPHNDRKGKKEANIAAVILAAGISARARRNKLMVDLDGKPLFMKAVEAAIVSKASPIFVITGYIAEELEEHMEHLDINILRNYDYASGIKTSIRLGLKSIPTFCEGTIIIPADMPNITPEYINKMIKSFNKGVPKQVCIASYRSRKFNPILWSTELYPSADLVPENSDERPVFIEHSDHIKLVETDKILTLDINFPNDIDELLKPENSYFLFFIRFKTSVAS